MPTDDWIDMADFALQIIGAADKGECVPRTSVAAACHMSDYMFKQHVEPVLIARSKTRLGQKVGAGGGYFVGPEGSTATFAAIREAMGNTNLVGAAGKLALADASADTDRRKRLVLDSFNERTMEHRRDIKTLVKQLTAGKSKAAGLVRGLLTDSRLHEAA